MRILKKEQIALPNNNLTESNSSQPYVSQLHQQRSHQDRMNRATHDEVSNIFKLLSDKEKSKQGLRQLYEFKENHPEVDIQPFLQGASPYFQQFINEGLAELKRSSQNNTNNNQCSGSGIDSDSGMRSSQEIAPNSSNSVDSDYWMQKLNMYRKRGKLNSNDEGNTMIDNKIADENLNMNQLQSRMTSSTKKDVSLHLNNALF